MISPRKNKGKGSPSKENVSPSRNPTSHKDEKNVPPEMLLSIIHELQMAIIKLGGKIPAHLTYYFGSPANQNTNEKFGFGLIKVQGNQQEYTRRLQQQSGKLKIKVSNYEFQIKKLEEDLAEYKLLSKMDKEKQIKKLKTEILRLEGQVKQDNKKWQEKIVQMRDLYQSNKNKEILSLKLNFQSKIKEESSRFINEINILKQKSQQVKKEIQTEWELKIIQVQEKNKLQSQRKQKQYTEQRAKLKQKHSEQTKKSEKKYESIITVLQSEKKVQNRKRTQQKIEASKEKEKLYNNLYLVRKDNQYLKKQIQELKQAVRQLEKELVIQKKKTEEIQYQKQKEVEKIKNDYGDAEERIRVKQKSEVIKMYQQHQRQIRRFEKLIANLEQLQRKKEDLSKSQYQELARNYQKRQSKLQDITLINQLNYDLLVKKNQIVTLAQEVKQIKMERQNNQKNYNRIFTCQTSRQRVHERPLTATKPKPYHKHGNTIDMSFLLKVCNKNF